MLRRNCLLKHSIEGKIEKGTEVTEGQGRRRKHLLNYLKQKSGYWKLEEKHQISLCGQLALEESVDPS